MRDHQLATANAQAAAMRNMKDHQLATANALEKMFTALEVFHIVIIYGITCSYGIDYFGHDFITQQNTHFPFRRFRVDMYSCGISSRHQGTNIRYESQTHRQSANLCRRYHGRLPTQR
jgi:hypothetical protein